MPGSTAREMLSQQLHSRAKPSDNGPGKEFGFAVNFPPHPNFNLAEFEGQGKGPGTMASTLKQTFMQHWESPNNKHFLQTYYEQNICESAVIWHLADAHKDSKIRERDFLGCKMMADEFKEIGGFSKYPNVVGMTCIFTSLSDISEKTDSFAAAGELHFRWFEPLALRHKDISDPDDNVSSMLVADCPSATALFRAILSPNIIAGSLELQAADELTFNSNWSDGVVDFVVKFNGTWFQQFDLRRFPFDGQYLSIMWKLNFTASGPRFGTLVIPDYQFDLNDPTRTSFGFEFGCKALELSEWTQYPARITFGNAHFLPSTGNPMASITLVQVKIVRKTDFWIFNVILLIFIFVTLGFLVFATPGGTDALGDRLGLTFTLLLTIVAFKFVVADKLPNVPYLTVLDKYVNVSIIVLGVVSMVNAVVPFAVDDVANVTRIEHNYALPITSGLWMAFNVYFIYRLIRRRLYMTATIGTPLNVKAHMKKFDYHVL